MEKEDFLNLFEVQKALTKHEEIQHDIIDVILKIDAHLSEIDDRISQYRADTAMVIVNCAGIESSQQYLEMLPNKEDHQIHKNALLHSIDTSMTAIREALLKYKASLEKEVTDVEAFDSHARTEAEQPDAF